MKSKNELHLCCVWKELQNVKFKVSGQREKFSQLGNKNELTKEMNRAKVKIVYSIFLSFLNSLRLNMSQL